MGNLKCNANVVFVVVLVAAFLLPQAACKEEKRGAQGKHLEISNSVEESKENVERSTKTLWDTLSFWANWASHYLRFRPSDIMHSQEVKDTSSIGGTKKAKEAVAKTYEIDKNITEDASEATLHASQVAAKVEDKVAHRPGEKIKQNVGKSGIVDHHHHGEL